MEAKRDGHRPTDGGGGAVLGGDRPVADVDPVDDYALADYVDESAVRPADVDVSALTDVGLEYLAVGECERAGALEERALADREAWSRGRLSE